MNTTLQKLIYGDRNLFISTANIDKNINLNNLLIVTDFILNLKQNGYFINNFQELFYLSNENFNIFKNELNDMFNSLSVQGFIFRKSFADSIEQKEYTIEDLNAIFAQYSITYNWKEEYNELFSSNPIKILEDYFSTASDKTDKLKTELKEFNVSFDFNNSITNIVCDILESNIVLRKQQIEVLNNTPSDILLSCYKHSNVIIKETETLVISLLIDKVDKKDIFSEPDQIVRFIAYNYTFNIVQEGFQKMEFEGQLTNSILKRKMVRIPTSIKKSIVYFLNNSNDTDFVVEKMFKYYRFWKKILSATKWTSDKKMKEKFPIYWEIKTKLYLDDRSETFFGKVERAKFNCDYAEVANLYSSNVGYLMRNLLELLRYKKGVQIAKKTRILIKENEEFYSDEEDNTFNLGDFIKDKIQEKELINNQNLIKEDGKSKVEIYRKRVVQTDASNFFKSKKFSKLLKEKANTKLLWQVLNLLENEELYKDRTERTVQKTYISYEIPLPALDKEMTKLVKKQIKKAISKIKKEENKTLGKVFISNNTKDFNVVFSGRASKEIVLSGEYLSPGSKIDLNCLDLEDKILRFGVAWKGEESCDIDHSINIIKRLGKEINGESVYYGYPVLNNNKGEVIISSSGDITSNNNDIFSVELIDIDIQKVKEDGIEELFTSLIQYSGKTLNNYEVLWFFNIIDKKDRVVLGQTIHFQVDQFQYAIQVTDEVHSSLGFFIDLKENFIEVLNIGLKNKELFQNSNSLYEDFKQAFNNRNKPLPLSKVLKKVINKNQIVYNLEEADIIIGKFSEEDKMKFNNKTFLYPGRDGEKINKIIF